MKKHLHWTDIDGIFYYEPFYRKLIAEFLKPGDKVAEVGVLMGRGVCYLAQEASGVDIYAVDVFKADGIAKSYNAADDWNFFERYMRNLMRAGVERKITTIALPSVLAATLFEDHFFTSVFIDAQHDYDALAADILAWLPKVKPGGIIAGDDYVEPYPGVIKAVDALVPNRTIMGQAWWAVV